MRFTPSYLRKYYFARYFVVFLLLIVFFLLFAVISCCLPDKKIKYQVKRASSTLAAYGNYPKSIFDLKACQQDYFTEALILNQVYCIDRAMPLKSAMKVGRRSETWNLPGDLWQLTHEKVNFNECTYPRYWHGSTFLTRFLLLFFNYAQIQWLFFATSLLLMLLFGTVYYPRAGILKTVAMLMSWALVYGFMWMFSLHYTPVFLITIVASILVVRFRSDFQRISLLFFVVGALTCYFDLLTVPLLSFGWPLLVWLSLYDDKRLKMIDLWTIVKWALLWLTGFAFTWMAKWALASLVLGYNVFADAAYNVSIRTEVSEEFSRWDAVVKNAEMIPWLMVIITVLVFVAGLSRQFRLPDWKRTGLYLLIALVPYLWYWVLSNHSYIHFWFTYRLQAITLVSMFLMICGFRKQRVR